MKPPRIVIFAKAPRAGFVKTRLIPAVGAEVAAKIAEKMLQHTVEEALATNFSSVELCVSPTPESLAWIPFRNPKWNVLWRDQGDGDLGERLTRAAKRVIDEGFSPIFVGTDCPDLNRQQMKMAAKQLSENDAVMIPSEDGGYVLLGISKFSSEVFFEVPWSTEVVARETLKRVHDLGWTLSCLPPLRDIDEPKDLEALPSEWRLT
ncbi:MAG: hypothetical protein RIR26_985 [Pseudomonadota bacterium]